MSGLRVVVAGGGANIFRATHIKGLEAIGAHVVALQDADLARAKANAELLGAHVVGTIGELLREESDLLVITASHPVHAEYAIAGLEAGKHVLVEKPMAVQVAEADRMVEAARRAGRVLAVAFQQRTRHELQEARRLVANGFLGRLQRADVLSSWPRRKTYYEVAPWRGTWRGEGGGVLINQGQHDLDLLCYLTGPPARLIGWTDHRLHDIETEDSVLAMLEWAEGATGCFRTSTVEVDEAQRIELTGTAGRIRILPGRLEAVSNGVDFREFASSDGDPFGAVPAGSATDFGGGGGTHVDLYRDLAEALATGRPPIAPADSAVAPLELANAIIYSSHTREEVRLPLDRAAYADLLESLRSAAGSRI